jgi:mersacidin/lichenicidin family type 2 lantibiotic
MSIDIVRAWKDHEYRKSLTPEEQALLPANPVEPIPTSEEEFLMIIGDIGMVTLGGPKRCGTKYPECCYNSTIGPIHGKL